MSTKTTFKRLALVTVAALGLGVLTTAPSQAAHLFDALTVTPVTSAINAGETATATVGLSFVAGADNDSVTVNAVATTIPAGGNGALRFTAVTDSATGTTAGTTGSAAIATTVATANTNANTKYTLSFVQPTVAGTYVVTVYTSSSVATPIKATPLTWSITVAAAPSPDSTSTAYISAGDSTPASADSATITASNSTLTGDVVASIVVTQNNNSAATTNPESMTVTVAGPGTITADSNVGRALTVKNGSKITVKADGASGVSTITIVGTTSGRAYGTKTLTFFGAVAAATATAVKPILNPSTTAQGAVLVKLTDAAGTAVSSAQTFYVTSSDVTKVAGNYTAQSVSYDATNTNAAGVALGAGYLVKLDGVAAGTASITVGTKSSATATTGVNAAPVSVRVGSETPASLTVSTDKTSYAPGEKATLTVVLKDATGLPVANKEYANVFTSTGITSSYSLGATSDSITGTSVTMADGVAEYTIYMPMSEKDVKFSWKTGTTTLAVANQGVAGSVTVAITSSAIEAANAATTAALAANDAVDALAATVAKLVANLKAQITALTKLIVKIQKKVGA
jgi:hypothetical protein